MGKEGRTEKGMESLRLIGKQGKGRGTGAE